MRIVDPWAGLIVLLGMFFIVAATRLGREHAQVLREPHDDIERTAAWSRWTFRLLGVAFIVYGSWRAIGL